MRNALFALAVASIASPAFAQRLASRPMYGDESPASLEGVYAGVGAAGSLLIFAGNAYAGLGAEGRIGYSFNPAIQLYLSGVFDDAVSGDGPSFKAEQIAVYVQYHLLVRPAVMVYARAGVGVGISGSLLPGATAAGLAEGGGLGVEIHVGPGIYLAPEFFYRGASLSAQGFTDSYQAIGIGLNLVYY